MKRILVVGITLFILALSAPMFAGNWILDSKTEKLPADLDALVLKAGGTLVKSYDEVGIAVAEFATREDAEAMEAYGFTVMPDIELNWLPGSENTMHQEHIGSDERYYGYQWHLPLINAPQAWDAGYTGQGARVAIVDTGIAYTHPDLAGNIDFASSATFVPGTTDFFDDAGHGSHVAGIVAAADNAFGTIGVAPNATLIGIKVLGSNGSGATSWIVAGIIHAANQDVDIINLSLGSTINKNGNMPDYNGHDVAGYIKMYRKALAYARSKGVLVISSAGNDAMDMDHNGNIVKLPAEAGNGVTVSATGPISLQNYYRLASYSNYGTNAITVSAPGGDFVNYPNPYWHYDMILSTTPTGWSWMAGTSMASPVAAGVAALIVGKYGSMSPAQLEQKLVKSTDDLGKPGADPAFGKGHVNAAKAVQ